MKHAEIATVKSPELVHKPEHSPRSHRRCSNQHKCPPNTEDMITQPTETNAEAANVTSVEQHNTDDNHRPNHVRIRNRANLLPSFYNLDPGDVRFEGIDDSHPLEDQHEVSNTITLPNERNNLNFSMEDKRGISVDQLTTESNAVRVRTVKSKSEPRTSASERDESSEIDGCNNRNSVMLPCYNLPKENAELSGKHSVEIDTDSKNVNKSRGTGRKHKSNAENNCNQGKLSHALQSREGKDAVEPQAHCSTSTALTCLDRDEHEHQSKVTVSSPTQQIIHRQSYGTVSRNLPESTGFSEKSENQTRTSLVWDKGEGFHEDLEAVLHYFDLCAQNQDSVELSDNIRNIKHIAMAHRAPNSNQYSAITDRTACSPVHNIPLIVETTTDNKENEISTPELESIIAVIEEDKEGAVSGPSGGVTPSERSPENIEHSSNTSSRTPNHYQWRSSLQSPIPSSSTSPAPFVPPKTSYFSQLCAKRARLLDIAARDDREIPGTSDGPKGKQSVSSGGKSNANKEELTPNEARQMLSKRECQYKEYEVTRSEQIVKYNNIMWLNNRQRRDRALQNQPQARSVTRAIQELGNNQPNARYIINRYYNRRVHRQDPQAVTAPPFGTLPALAYCKRCNKVVETALDPPECSCFQWKLCFLLALIGWPCCLCVLPGPPCCGDLHCTDVHHHCSICQLHLGSFYRQDFWFSDPKPNEIRPVTLTLEQAINLM